MDDPNAVKVDEQLQNEAPVVIRVEECAVPVDAADHTSQQEKKENEKSTYDKKSGLYRLCHVTHLRHRAPVPALPEYVNRPRHFGLARTAGPLCHWLVTTCNITGLVGQICSKFVDYPEEFAPRAFNIEY